MRYLIDTNVLSETFKRAPDRKVVRWLTEQSPLDLYLSVLTLGELTMGFELAPAGKRREQLQRWVSQDLARQFIDRILEVDAAVSREWGKMSAFGRTSGRELPAIDGLLLATAQVHQLVFVTRNERDCTGRGPETLNPWK